MTDPLVVTTQTSWFSRLRSAFAGMVTGLVLIVTAVGVLFWNEGRSAEAIRVNKEGTASVHPVPAGRVDPANEGRLIHVTAPANAEGERRDAALGISTPGLVLTRKVEYYQWREVSRSESRTKLGGGEETVTTYSYEQEWSKFPQDSGKFKQADKHRNPAPGLQKAEYRAERARVGGFTVDQNVLGHVAADRALELTAEQADAAKKALSRPVTLAEGGFYIGANPATPQIGDMRVTYSVAEQGATLSIIGAQTTGTIQPYPTKSGGQILMVRTGTASADQMFAQAKSGNSTMTWVLRLIGYAGLAAAFGMVLAPLGVVGDVVPFIGSILRFGTGLVSGLAAFAIGTLTIAIAWLFYRPLLTLALVGLIAGVVYGVLYWRRRRMPVTPATAA